MIRFLIVLNFCFLILIISIESVNAETIHLKDGTTIKGKVINSDEINLI